MGKLLDRINQRYEDRQPARPSALAESARFAAPPVRVTLRETENNAADIALLTDLVKVIKEYPGGNRVHLIIHELAGNKAVMEWSALASRDMRMALARTLLAHPTMAAA